MFVREGYKGRIGKNCVFSVSGENLFQFVCVCVMGYSGNIDIHTCIQEAMESSNKHSARWVQPR